MTCRYMNSNIKCSSEAAESVLNECTVEQMVHMDKCLSGAAKDHVTVQQQETKGSFRRDIFCYPC